MNSTSSHDLNSSTGITQMSEAIIETNSNQPLPSTTEADIDITHEEKHLLVNEGNSSSNQIDHVPLESSPSMIAQKQKSLLSVYDNSNDGGEQQLNLNSFPLVGILGRNQRSQAFLQRLLLSGFPKSIQCDINSVEIDPNEKSCFVSHETFYQLSPPIILITDNLITNFEHLFHQDKQQLIIDTREIVSKKSAEIFLPIPESYRAFGNLSNWEIEHGTQRVRVAVDQSSPLNLIKFIHDLNCFSRGIYFVDQYSYGNERIKSFRYCRFPFISTLIIFSLCFIFSLVEYSNHTSYHSDSIFRQASSITGITSLTLLALCLLIRPIIQLMEFVLKKQTYKRQNIIHVLLRLAFIQRWLQSRGYLAWYSLSFALFHLIFLIFSKNDLNQEVFFYPFLFGLFSLILLCILSSAYLPWISERLLWHEYRLLTSFVGRFSLLIAVIHVFIHWKYENYSRSVFQLKYLSIILPAIVLILCFIVYGIIHPIIKFIKWNQTRQSHNKTSALTTKDTLLLP